MFGGGSGNGGSRGCGSVSSVEQDARSTCKVFLIYLSMEAMNHLG